MGDGKTLDSAVIDLFIFDWSGVISDDRITVYMANMRVFEHYGIDKISFEEWRMRSIRTEIEILRNHGCKAPDEEIHALYVHYLGKVKETGTVPVVYPGAVDVLQHLKGRGKRLALLSSHPEDHLREEAKGYGINHRWFDLVQGGSRDKAGGLTVICRELDVPPEKTLFTGDTIYDVRAAKDAKVLSAAVNTGYHDKERLALEGPDFQLDELSGLKLAS